MKNGKEKQKLYVGCSLTNATEAFKQSVEDFKTALRNADYEVFDFIGLVNGTSADVYKWDIGHCVHDCDLFIGVCAEPSIGLGWEMGEATRLHKPVLALVREGDSITRLVIGASEVEANVCLVHYNKLTDIVPLICKYLPR